MRERRCAPGSNKGPGRIPGGDRRDNRPGLGLPLNVGGSRCQRRASVVNCDMMLDVVNDPAVHEGKFKLSRPYQRSGLVLGRPGRNPSATTTEGRPEDPRNSVRSQRRFGKAGKRTSPCAFQSGMIDELARAANCTVPQRRYRA